MVPAVTGRADSPEPVRDYDEPVDAFADIFDDDYVYFTRSLLTDERSDRDVDLIWRMLGLTGGQAVLDVPCGSGRIANRLAARGCRVVGVDANERFLAEARADAGSRGVDVEYRRGDMRELDFVEQFDGAVNWFTSFGYFDDAGNKAMLRRLHRSLRPGGALLVDMLSRESLVRGIPAGQQQSVHVVEIGQDLLVDRWALDVIEGRCVSDRIMVRDGRLRRTLFTFRLPTFPEARQWLTDAGFTSVAAHDELGGPYSIAARRMVIVARR
ncbi:MAG: class I SAM-dependent methyltransferase [Chloroflexi bacterium]|nr:MAG: class I SAM-dependent methyltransferase [Chloroflexota bacterium]